MRWLVFLARVAMICNLAFVVCIITMYSHFSISSRAVQSTIIILGLLSFLFNAIIIVTEVVLVLFRKPSPINMWFRAFIFIVFVIQFIIYFLLHHAELS